MICKQIVRHIHFSRIVCATDKNALGTLRKRTGYTFSNCKKALELHNNDVQKAEQWLKEQAQALGWSKATKLEGRSTKQGLVGVLIQNNIGALVEVNCETDFVARNTNFQQFVETVSKTCIQHVEDLPSNNGLLSKFDFESDTLKQLKAGDGKSLGDHLSLMIGTVSENSTLRRATCFKATESTSLIGLTHPTVNTTGKTVQFGKYGVIVALKSAAINEDVTKNICQHIVGMNPQQIGVKGKDEKAANSEDETCLIHQEYLLDPSITFDEFVNENGVEIVDFKRYECGETDKQTEVRENVAATAN